MDRKKKDLDILNDFKISIQLWTINHRSAERCKINQLLPKVRNILKVTNSNKYVNIDAPLTMGGQHIVENGNCLDFIFDAPFNLDVTPYIYDAIDTAIGVLSDDEYEYPIERQEVVANAVQSNFNNESKNVFIVHGHDCNTRNEVELLVKQLGYQPIVLFKQPNIGDTIIEKLFREAKDTAFAIVLYTKCDEGKAAEETDLKPRARQNVVFEHGLMCGLLGRKRVVALVDEGVEIPGDLSGVVYIPLDMAKRWQLDVAREMKASGLNLDLNKLA